MIRKTEFKYLIRKTEFNEYLICKTEFIRNRYRNDNEPILNYIDKFKNHPSIKVIKSRKIEEQTKLLLLAMFLMKKFLTKLGNYKLRKQHNKMIFQQKF